MSALNFSVSFFDFLDKIITIAIINIVITKIVNGTEDVNNLSIMLNNYALLVGRISRLYNFSDIFFRSGENFHHTEINVKALRKKLER